MPSKRFFAGRRETTTWEEDWLSGLVCPATIYLGSGVSALGKEGGKEDSRIQRCRGKGARLIFLVIRVSDARHDQHVNNTLRHGRLAKGHASGGKREDGRPSQWYASFPIRKGYFKASAVWENFPAYQHFGFSSYNFHNVCNDWDGMAWITIRLSG